MNEVSIGNLGQSRLRRAAHWILICIDCISLMYIFKKHLIMTLFCKICHLVDFFPNKNKISPGFLIFIDFLNHFLKY